MLASINYERLLELSLIEEGLQPFIGCPSENVNKIELCLPHGCCHLFCESVKADSSAVSFNARCITTRGSVVAISSLSEFQRRIDTDAFPPVMSYFEPEKTTTSGVNFIERQRSRFSETTSNAVIIIIIGVKVRPNENHIWGPLAKTSAKLIYCAGKRSGQEFDNWKNRVRSNYNDLILKGYFDESFEQICSALNID